MQILLYRAWESLLAVYGVLIQVRREEKPLWRAKLQTGRSLWYAQSLVVARTLGSSIVEAVTLTISREAQRMLTAAPFGIEAQGCLQCRTCVSVLPAATKQLTTCYMACVQETMANDS